MSLLRLPTVFLTSVFLAACGSSVLASPCASLTATVLSEPTKVGEPVVVQLTLTNKMADAVVIYEEVAAWDYRWEVRNRAGAVLKLTKIGEHYADKSPHDSVGRRRRKLARGESVAAQIDLNELVVFPGAGDYLVKFSRTFELSGRRSCAVVAEPLHFLLETGQ